MPCDRQKSFGAPKHGVARVSQRILDGFLGRLLIEAAGLDKDLGHLNVKERYKQVL